MGRAIWIGILLWLVQSQAATARPLCRLEQPVLRGDQVEVLATQVSLRGQLQRGGPWALELRGEAQVLQPLQQRLQRPDERPLWFVILVEASAAYAPATDALRAALARFLVALPRASQGQLWLFAEHTSGLSGFRPATILLGEAAHYNAIAEGELRLVRAILQAQAELLKAPDGARRALIVLADGRNSVMERQLIRNIGENLGRHEVPLFAIGFSPQDMRWPLLNLGDLAKRSGGTFRWARTANDLGAQLINLSDELKGAQVITFAGDGLTRLGTLPQLRLRCGEGVSNFCHLGKVPPSGSLFGYGAIVLLCAGGLSVYCLRRRTRASRSRSGMAAVSLPHTLPRHTAPQSILNEKLAREARGGGVGAPPIAAGDGGAHSALPSEGARERAPLNDAAPTRPLLVAADGRGFAISDRLELGPGLAGPGTIALGLGPQQVLCAVVREGNLYKLVAHACGVRLNGHALIGKMRLQDRDRIGIDGMGEWTFHR